MRVAVIGAGAVGGVIAALLTRDGHLVDVTARGEHLAAIRRNGIALSGALGEYTARLTATERLEHYPELAIVATKAQDAVAAIRENVSFLRDIPILVIQNGLDGVSAAAAASPRSHVVGALAMLAASYVAPGKVAVTTAGPLYISGGEKHDVAARHIASVLTKSIPTRVINNFVGAQWTKLVVNQINALPAITGLSAQDVIADRRLRRIMTASIRETVVTGIRAGVTFGTLEKLSNRRLRILARLPLFIGQILPILMKRRLGTVPNPGSTLQSIRRGQPTEIDFLNGAVVASAAAHNQTAPINAALTELVHEVEQSGHFLDVATVVARVTIR